VSDLGRLLILAGAALLVLGAVLTVGGRIPFLGRLPGDIAITRGSTHIYFPLATSLLISVVLTVLLTIFLRGR